jgi:hypothetical protein
MAYYYYKEYNILELHYWLEGSLHSMDAFVQNKCEQELLKLLKQIAEAFDSNLIIETEPLSLGGLKRKYNIIPKEYGNKATIKTAVITALLTGILATPITTSISKICEKAIENVFKDKEKETLDKEKEKLEILKLKQEIQNSSNRLQENSIIEKSRVSFYRQLEKEQSVERVSFIQSDEKGNQIENEVFVNRSNFGELKVFREITKAEKQTDERFIKLINRAEENKLETIQENASIEITSPNFTNSGEWMGIYNGTMITFQMKSAEFYDNVQKGAIQFKKGTTITCVLIETKVGNEISYDVLSVTKYDE